MLFLYVKPYDFFKDKDREEIKREIPTYFPYLKIQLWYEEDELIGFSGNK